RAVVIPAIPPPRITTDVPAPTFAGQSPGRGEGSPPGGGGGAGGGGAGDAEEDAEEEPHADSVVLIPKAAMICNMADPPTALPIDARKSRLAIRILFALIVRL
ncbi:MAG: hypothetical protein VYC03_00080, partial [Pseudomonadota bacterium]|nr:hypothetical protein [Pseudomonadota bacterium]